MNEEQIAAILGKVGPRTQPGAEATAAVRKNVQNAWRTAVLLQRRRRRVALAVAASLCLAVSAAFVTLRAPAPASAAARLAYAVNTVEYRPSTESTWLPVREAAALQPGVELRLGGDSYAALDMTGGASLHIDAGSRLRLVDGSSLYLESGAVYADAEGTSTLNVRATYGTVRDIGTRYAVRLHDAGWRIQVREGSVVVDDRRAGRAKAQAGERLLAQGPEFTRQPVAPADASWQWTQAAAPPLAIDGATFGTYLDWWSRETGVQVSFQKAVDEIVARRAQLHGSLQGLTVDEGFDAMLAVTGYRVVDRSAGKVMLAR